MDVVKAITSRRSIRDFKDRRVERDDLLFLCELGMKAPTSGNLQDFRFIISRDRNKIAALPSACMDQDWMRYATGVIVICSQPKEQIKWYGEMGNALAIQNAAAAAQNILLGAHSIGLGACWVSGFSREKVEKIFGIKGGAKPEIIIALGYPAGKPESKASNAMDVMVYFDSYGNDKADALMLNKDYSEKLQQHLAEAEFQTKREAKKIQPMFDKIRQQIKEKMETMKNKEK